MLYKNGLKGVWHIFEYKNQNDKFVFKFYIASSYDTRSPTSLKNKYKVLWVIRASRLFLN